MRVVLDTNVLVKCIGRNTPFRPIFDALLAGAFDLVVSTSILLEYEEVLAERNGPLVGTSILAVLLTLANIQRQRVSYDFRLVPADPDDDKFTDAYVAGQADYLVTDDRHFRGAVQSKFPTVRVVSTADFLQLLKQGAKPVSNDRHLGGLSAAGFPAVRVVDYTLAYTFAS